MRRVIVFSGHRVDSTDRPVPRFPSACELHAAQRIARAIPKNSHVGISSAANGGDILFLEACAARALPFHIVLPFSIEVFIQRSVVTDAPGNWEARFHSLWLRTPTNYRHILTVPDGANPYVACNDALLVFASELGSPEVIALWDGERGNRPGGTFDLVSKVRAKGWPVRVIAP